MKDKIAGSILLGFSGLVATIGTVGSQIAYALVKAGFYAGALTGEVPPGPQSASIHGVVVVTTIVLAILGLYFIFRPERA
jgi:hypothetical protein